MELQYICSKVGRNNYEEINQLCIVLVLKTLFPLLITFLSSLPYFFLLDLLDLLDLIFIFVVVNYFNVGDSNPIKITSFFNLYI